MHDAFDIQRHVHQVYTGQKTLEGHVMDEWNGYCLATVVTDVVLVHCLGGGFGRECDEVHQRLYVCVYMCMHASVYVCMCLYVCTCTCVYVHISVYGCNVSVRVHVDVSACVCVATYGCMCVLFVCACMCVCVCVHVFVYVCM